MTLFFQKALCYTGGCSIGQRQEDYINPFLTLLLEPAGIPPICRLSFCHLPIVTTPPNDVLPGQKNKKHSLPRDDT